MSEEQQNRLLNIRELAQLTGLQVSSLYHFLSESRIPEDCIVRFSRRCIRFRLPEILRWFDSLSGKSGVVQPKLKRDFGA